MRGSCSEGDELQPDAGGEGISANAGGASVSLDAACARGTRELETSNRHVIHGQLLVRISLHASFSCRWPALIRGRSHPIRFANGTWLAAHAPPGSLLTAPDNVRS